MTNCSKKTAGKTATEIRNNVELSMDAPALINEKFREVENYYRPETDTYEFVVDCKTPEMRTWICDHIEGIEMIHFNPNGYTCVSAKYDTNEAGNCIYFTLRKMVSHTALLKEIVDSKIEVLPKHFFSDNGLEKGKDFICIGKTLENPLPYYAWCNVYLLPEFNNYKVYIEE